MKKVSSSRKQYNIRRQKRIEKMRRKQSAAKVLYPLIIKMPTRLSIYDAKLRKKLNKCLIKLREASFNKVERIIIDFSATRFAFADAMILIYAEVDRIVNSSKTRSVIKCRVPNKVKALLSDRDIENAEKIRQLIKHIGLLKILKQTDKVIPERDDVVRWTSAKGVKSEGEKADSILNVVESELGERVAKKFYTGITEAMTNSYHHAYQDSRMDGLDIQSKGWWLFMNVNENNLSIIVCDLGIGIPRSLPLKFGNVVYKFFESVGRKISDSGAIQYAAGLGATSTNLQHRGKGLRKMIDVVKEINGANLVIYSNSGRFFAKNAYGIEFIRADYQDSILGTIICWQVPLGGLHEDS